MKEFIEIVKSLLQNKRTRALAILILYFIFFIFVFGIISSNNTTKDNDLKTENETPEVPIDEFYYLNNIEILNYNVYDIYNNIVEEYNINLVNNKVIYNLVKNSILAETNHIENSNTYYLNISDYERIINNTNLEIEGIIKITLSDNIIILDFTNYYGYKINIQVRS